MATFGIEIQHKIFRLSKNTDHSVNIKCSKIGNANLGFFIPKSNETTFNKLMLIDSFCKKLVSRNIKFYHAFYEDGDKFEKAVCTLDEEDSKDLRQPQEFEKVAFEFKDDHFVLKHGSTHNIDSNENDFVLTNHLNYHPIFDSHEYRPIYKSYQQTLSALQDISEFEGTIMLQERINIRDEYCRDKNTSLKHPFIVVEGLDGTGKSTATKNIAKYFNAVAMSTPPPSIGDIRKKFDKLPELYRRSYYAFSNYLASQEVLRALDTKPVVMDRYWHSTTSYAIAKEASCGTDNYLPPKGHSVLQWPEDLLRPSAVIFLTTKEKDRHTRVEERGDATTEEEKYISASKNLRARIMETYRRIGFTKWIEVDTSGTKEETLAKAVEGLKLNGISSWWL